jgi:2-oxoglutarate dehydrogenase complex dehydrogenase (E1) component-like enzyme
VEGDVKYHMGYSSMRGDQQRQGREA